VTSDNDWASTSRSTARRFASKWEFICWSDVRERYMRSKRDTDVGLCIHFVECFLLSSSLRGESHRIRSLKLSLKQDMGRMVPRRDKSLLKVLLCGWGDMPHHLAAKGRLLGSHVVIDQRHPVCHNSRKIGCAVLMTIVHRCCRRSWCDRKKCYQITCNLKDVDFQAVRAIVL